MDAVKFASELGRMCGYLNKNCSKCKIDEMGGFESCIDWFSKEPEQAVSIVEQWSNEHPVKTCLDDFMEKYPKGVIAEETWCSLYNQGSVHRDGCRTDFCQDCFGWSESAEKYL